MRYWMLTALLVGTLAYGCGKQGEGQRCDIDNGDNDCDDNLSCVTRSSIQGAVCCPSDNATALACLDDVGTTSSSTTTGAGGSGGSGGSGTGGTGGTGGTSSAGGGTATGGAGGS